MPQIPGAQQLINWTTSKIKLTIVFEVVDDAGEALESRAYLKPVDIWFVFSDQSKNLPLKPDEFTRQRT